jgi:predicted NUDIX family NTP pyrophosphohydrolase
MPGALSAGLLMCRILDGHLEYFLVHPGGPFFKNKDHGAWSIPKGLPEHSEDLLATAQREFSEETGIMAKPPFFEIGFVRQKSGKMVHAWTFLGLWEPEEGISCNNFSLEWPPRSGKKMEFPEVDKARWMHYNDAKTMIMAEQSPFLDRAKLVYKLA